ncbi:MAG: low specificity L-threonine aldolase [Cephaloticoccus sp.]|nr:low specificity L-threonine aldolase [Cephaloticoccus sp.]
MPDIFQDFTFASDNTAGMAPEALAALTAANAGHAPSYGKDEWTRRAVELLTGVFETDCEVFFIFNGTAANAVAFSALCQSYHRIFCHEHSHADVDECGAPELFTGGAKIIPLAAPDCKLTPTLVEHAVLKRTDVHHPKAGALSLTQSTEWGTVYSPAEIRALCATAKQHGLTVQMDGARFANAVAATGVQPADLTWRAGVDVLCLGGTKNGMNTTEAVVFFNRELARDFAFRVKQSGQLASKQRFASAQWVGMLESGAWLRHAAHANAMARRLATALRTLPGIKFIAEPAANGVFVELPAATVDVLWAQGWHFHRFIGNRGYRLMCSWATPPDTVDRFVAALRATLPQS